ncbi:hypothetical protein [Siphonobacter sp. SORGH_AS_1065]|uniref:hypothetical protein n=1 Tax=Siphonobacter sp. SORGH_AS_1065 TaxID=3041795 RepID=UPI002782EBFB|nr:hypothetical protein [Siphonobacter sp. SORGH_AS_1065]MDQ1089921.1 hypothetical protein [Siphonobacter sp. SORGH_AS_1065]
MKPVYTFAFLLALGLTSCQKKDIVPVSPATTKEKELLYSKFHGKYKIISSVSSEPLDVNLDGTASNNMLEEMQELTYGNNQQYSVELRIYKGTSSSSSNKSNYLFTQWWPEQYINVGSGVEWNGGDFLDYNPKLSVSYLMQGTVRTFDFLEDLSRISVNAESNENPYRWVKPSSITISKDGRLTVVNKRHIYTKAGVKEVTITTVYERYTMTM